MTNTMTHKGYTARIEYDDADAIFTGRIAGILDRVGFHADTVDGLREAFHEALEDYIETCARISKERQKTYSGQLLQCVMLLFINKQRLLNIISL